MLEVAGRAFAAHGYHAASMDEIAARADVSKPMLYAYFESKQGLYLAYIRRMGDDLLERLRRAPREEPDPARRLEAGVHAFFGFVDEQRDGWAVLYHEASAQGGAVAAEVATLRDQLIHRVTELLEQCVADRDAPPADRRALEAFAHAVVGAGESLANWWLAHPDVSQGTVVRWLMGITANALPDGRSAFTRSAGAHRSAAAEA